MYYNDYKDYMRNVLGYSNMDDNTYQRYDGNCCGMNCNSINYNNIPCNNMPVYQFQARNDVASIEQMYPEIYRLINPMVCKMCDNNTQPVTECLIEQMTNDIYDNVVNHVEIQSVINLNIGTREIDTEDSIDRDESCNSRNTSTISSNRNNGCSNNSNSSTNCMVSQTVSASKSKETEDNRELRSPQSKHRRRNKLLQDLIRILILNRLIRPGRPHRPPFRPGNGMYSGMNGNRQQVPMMEDSYMANGYMPYI